MMIHCIATDAEGNVVGKWVGRARPEIPERFEVKEVENVSDYDLDYLYIDE